MSLIFLRTGIGLLLFRLLYPSDHLQELRYTLPIPRFGIVVTGMYESDTE